MAQLGLLVFNGAVTVLAFVLFFAVLAFGPDIDHFADHLTIPENIPLSVPEAELKPERGGPEDTLQTALLSALDKPGDGDATINASLPSLRLLETNAPDVLRRYLACNPAWRVFQERGETFATRRWMIGPDWNFTLHGYYDRANFDRFQENGIPNFQVRITLGLSGKPWWRGDRSSTQIKENTPVKAKLVPGNGLLTSHCIITGKNWPVEIFEKSADAERRATKSALEQIEAELAPLAQKPDTSMLFNLLPPNAIKTDEPSFKLRNDTQPGIYESEIWTNPGEPGRIYLKAFEITKGTPLSEAQLKETSNEWVGWSKDPSQLFLANGNFMIYEGDWGKPYAARFEVWFIPESGAPERKLMERNFKIEGWQR